MYGWSSLSRYYKDESSDEEEESMGPRASKSSSSSSSSVARLNSVLNGEGENAERALGTVSIDSERDPTTVIDGVAVFDEHQDLDAEAKAMQKFMCTECGDQPSVLTCDQCKDAYCDVCFQSQHKGGKRAKHTKTPIVSSSNSSNSSSSISNSNSNSSGSSTVNANSDNEQKNDEAVDEGDEVNAKDRVNNKSNNNNNNNNNNKNNKMNAEYNDDDDDLDSPPPSSSSSSFLSRFFPSSSYSYSSSSSSSGVQLSALNPHDGAALGIRVLPKEWFEEKVKYIPLRLTLVERKYLRLMESTLTVSEYTDKIDVISSKDKVKRIVNQLKDVCAILTGLVVACDYKLGSELCESKEFRENETFFQDIFEIARRHKIRNPEKMRTAYGKLVYLLQDSAGVEVQELLQFKLARPIRTVYECLKEKNALAVLNDPWIAIATGDIMTEGRSRPQINKSIKIKEAALAHLASKYNNDQLPSDNLKQTIYSICDNHSYLSFNLGPIEKMIALLKTHFSPDKIETPARSLAILAGRNGARLTHSHEQQYHYCVQSLTLWAAIQEDFFRLWYLAELDLLDSTNPYRLRNTGQGLNRVQTAPRISRVMHNILHSCQSRVDQWVGSSVIHLGDHNVPNALMFIDKYNQISRILNPIVLTINHIPKLMEKPDIRTYIINTFGSPEQLIVFILGDFFRHAFDGSGADNFFDAGSCIDGRLTSAWNWCSHVDKKPYYSIFLLSGFQGFDGEWGG